MEFEQFKFVYIETDYLKALHEVDGEISFDEKGGYENKPHLGILITDNKYRYVMPLTSAKEKHKKWRDITSTNYRVYEVIDIRTAKTDKDDIIVNENDFNKLRIMGVSSNDYHYYKKRILSILEIKKMFPVPDGKYSLVDLNTPSNDNDTEKRRILMTKEYFFCRKYMDAIRTKAESIYETQISTGVVMPYHCDYKKLEEIANKYNSENKKENTDESTT